MNTDHMPPPTPQELVSQMRANYQAFLSACEDLTEAQALAEGVCGEWSAKAVVDHLTGWQVESLPIVKKLLESAQESLDLEIDSFNRTSVKSREDLSWEESLAVFKDSFDAFDRAMAEVTVSRYRTNQAFKSWVKAMNHEYQFHLAHIRSAQER